MSIRELIRATAGGENGQAALLLLGLMAALLVGALFLGSGVSPWAPAASTSAPRTWRRSRPRGPCPTRTPASSSRRGIPTAHRIRATSRWPPTSGSSRDAALTAGRRNGIRLRSSDVRFPRSFAPTRVTVIARGEARLRVRGSRRRPGRIPVRARATAELSASGGPTFPASASGGGYQGPLSYRQGKPMRPDVAQAFDRMPPRRRAATAST